MHEAYAKPRGTHPQAHTEAHGTEIRRLDKLVLRDTPTTGTTEFYTYPSTPALLGTRAPTRTTLLPML
jgi:hypothetical protein